METRIMWAAWAVTPVVAAWAYSAGDTPEAAWQYAGGVLELAGFALVITDLELRLERFGDRPGPIVSAARRTELTVRRIVRRFGWKPKDQTVNLKAAEGKWGVGGANASLSVGPPKGKIDDRVEWLERQVMQFSERLRKVKSEATDERAKLRQELHQEVADLRGEVEEVKATVRESIAAGFGLELTGVGLFALGVVLGTWGPAFV